MALDGHVLLMARPGSRRAFGASAAQLQWTSTGYLVAVAALLVLAGRLGDRDGHLRLLRLGLTGFGLASAGIALASWVGWVIGPRVAQGVCGALLQPATLAVLRPAYPGKELRRAVAVRTGAIAVAAGNGPVPGGLLVAHFGRQSVFWISLRWCSPRWCRPPRCRSRSGTAPSRSGSAWPGRCCSRLPGGTRPRARTGTGARLGRAEHPAAPGRDHGPRPGPAPLPPSMGRGRRGPGRERPTSACRPAARPARCAPGGRRRSARPVRPRSPARVRHRPGPRALLTSPGRQSRSPPGLGCTRWTGGSGYGRRTGRGSRTRWWSGGPAGPWRPRR